MGSFREIEARFNKYLSQPEENTEDAREYQKIFNKIHDVLSMRKERLAADNVLRAGGGPADRRFQQSAGRRCFRRSVPGHLYRMAAKTNGKNKGKMMDAMERETAPIPRKSLMESGVTVSSGSPSNQKGGRKGNSSSNPRGTIRATSIWKSAWWRCRPAN